MTDDELKHLFDGLRQENSAAHTETRRQFEATVFETRRHFDVASKRLENRFDLLGESVAHVNAELQHTRTTLNEKIEQTAAETQAMIKFSHTELDRRVAALEESHRTLEGTVTELQTRVERLEGSAH